MKFVWQHGIATYHPAPADGLPDYVADFYKVARTSDEMASVEAAWEAVFHAFDPYPGFTYTDDWTFTQQDLIETWIPLDKSNVFRLLGGGVDPTQASAQATPLIWAVGVTQPAASQLVQVLFASPRDDGWVDLEGERHEAQG